MDIISRAEAKERGLKHYFTGSPCKYGHMEKRFVSDGTCFICSKIKLKIAYIENPEKQRKRTRERRIKNPDNARAAQQRLLSKDPAYFRKATQRYEARRREDRHVQNYIDTMVEGEA